MGNACSWAESFVNKQRDEWLSFSSRVGLRAPRDQAPATPHQTSPSQHRHGRCISSHAMALPAAHELDGAIDDRRDADEGRGERECYTSAMYSLPRLSSSSADTAPASYSPTSHPLPSPSSPQFRLRHAPMSPPGLKPGDIARLERIPWAASLLADKSFVLAPTSSRQSKDSGEDSFMAETLNTDRTVRSWVTQHSLPAPDEKPAIREIRSFLDVGDGLNGYPATMHGGMIATLLDEVTGVLLTTNLEYEKTVSGNSERGLDAMTAYLNITYKNPLPLPSIVLGQATFTKMEGRKSYVRATLEDGNGKVYAIGEALFVQLKPKI